MKFLEYIFNRAPGAHFGYYIPAIASIFILFAAAIGAGWIYKKRKEHDFAFKRLFKKTSGRLVLLGILFLLLVIFRYENIPYFSMRIWLYLAILLFLYFLYKTLRAYKVDYPREHENVLRNHHIKEEQKYTANKR